MNPADLRAIFAAILCAASAGCVAPPAQPPSPVDAPADAPAARPLAYMADLRKAEADVVAAEKDKSAFAGALMMLATQQSMIGDTEAAIANFDRAQDRRQPNEADRAAAAAILEQHEIRDAVAAIVEAARDRQIVILNEAHHVPRHRAFSTVLMLELRKAGFEYFAAETFAPQTAAMAARGYSLIDDGYYNRDPVFGDLIRRAIAGGYELIAYEHSPKGSDPKTEDEWAERIAMREEGEAQNLVDRVFAKKPEARVFMHVGYGHAREIPINSAGGRQTLPMAGRLREKTGIDPLTIDQTSSRPLLSPLAELAFSQADGDSIVLRSRADGAFWSGLPGYDVNVLHRPTRIVAGRPHWLAMGGYRAPWSIPARLLPKKGRRLVQAFVANESGDAVPMDQVLVEATKPPPKLMLPKGNYRFAVQD